MSASLSLSSGRSIFKIADTHFSFEVSPLLQGPIQLPIYFESFAAPSDSPIDIGVTLKPASLAAPSEGAIVFESMMNWRVCVFEETYGYEWYHPLSAAVLMRAEWRAGSDSVEIGFDLRAWRRMEETHWRNVPNPGLTLLPPFEQLPFVAPLAWRDAFLVHACGATRDGLAYVFAGHSGDGKTTLSRLLISEGFELLSDERVVIRGRGSSFMAYGTPWPGEGNAVSPAGFPLAGIFLLCKGSDHQVRGGKRAVLASEFLARAIVPYYLPIETEMILALLQELAQAVPLKELQFARKGGLARVLASD